MRLGGREKKERERTTVTADARAGSSFPRRADDARPGHLSLPFHTVALALPFLPYEAFYFIYDMKPSFLRRLGFRVTNCSRRLSIGKPLHRAVQ
jgi:hypothetical protein